MSRPHRCLRPIVSALLLTLLAACTPYSTYPPVETGEALVPWMYPVPQVMSKALRTTYEKTVGSLAVPAGQPGLVYSIPEGISDGVWRQVGIDAGVEGSRPMTEEDMFLGTPIWAIEQVRIRNRRAEVDVIFPVTDGYERATIILEADPFQPYVVKFFQRWRVPVEPPVYTGPTRDEDVVEETEGSEAETATEAVDMEAFVVEDGDEEQSDASVEGDG